MTSGVSTGTSWTAMTSGSSSAMVRAITGQRRSQSEFAGP